MTQERPERRARSVALLGLIFEIALSVFFALLTVWSRSESMRALTLLTASGVLVWLFLVLVYHQRVLVQDEAFETEQLRRERSSGAGSGAIFDVADEQLLLARRRLQWMYRWLLPAFTVAVIAALAVSGLAYWPWSLGQSLSGEGWRPVENANLLIWFAGVSALLSFLLSRYATGMARQVEWRMLGAGASYLMGVTMAGAAVAVSLAGLRLFETPRPERVVAYVLRVLLLVLAGEITLNFVLDFYRPRARGQEPRPAFDSRLLGLFTEPGGIARSIAEAVNYQFGFEVSSTWFDKLLQRSIVPLMGFGVVTLFAVSSFVFVGADQEAVVVRFGRRLEGDLGPGLHVKWPWPIDVAYRVATARIHELKIGVETDVEKREGETEELILWTNKTPHDPHLEVLIATPELAEFLTPGSSLEQEAKQPPGTRPAGADSGEGGEAVPVSLLRVAVSIQYRIREAYDWLRTYEDPEGMLEAIADREIMRYCANVDVAGLMGPERGPIERKLWEGIQKASDQRNLGVDLVFLGLQGVHPPQETAQDFQDVIGAESKRTTSINSARADYNKRLSEVAGDMKRAERLGEAIQELHRLADQSGSQEDIEPARERVQTLFFGDAERGIGPVGGQAAERIVQAREKRWRWENKAHGQAVSFEEEMATRNAAPRVYEMRKYLQALAESLHEIRKYVIATGSDVAVQTVHMNLQDQMRAPLEAFLEGEKK